MATKRTSNNPKGRPKGIPNKRTIEFKQGVNNLITHATPKMIEWLEEVAMDDPKGALDLVYKFAQFGYPLQARTEIAGDPDKPIHVTEVKRTIIDTSSKK